MNTATFTAFENSQLMFLKKYNSTAKNVCALQMVWKYIFKIRYHVLILWCGFVWLYIYNVRDVIAKEKNKVLNATKHIDSEMFHWP